MVGRRNLASCRDEKQGAKRGVDLEVNDEPQADSTGTRSSRHRS